MGYDTKTGPCFYAVGLMTSIEHRKGNAWFGFRIPKNIQMDRLDRVFAKCIFESATNISTWFA